MCSLALINTLCLHVLQRHYIRHFIGGCDNPGRLSVLSAFPQGNSAEEPPSQVPHAWPMVGQTAGLLCKQVAFIEVALASPCQSQYFYSAAGQFVLLKDLPG